jgi:hypothetical protein
MCKEIPLSRGLVALVDAADYERVSQYKWCVDGNGYVVRNESYYVNGKRKRRQILLHRFIMSAPPNAEVDHRFHNRLDNRRKMLRMATRKQNSANMRPQRDSRSAYKGVSWRKRDCKWEAYIRIDGKHKFLGTHQNERDAAIAYDTAAYAAWGEFAYLNVPHPHTSIVSTS